MSQNPQPAPPQHLSAYAQACLQALASNELGDKISLGGAVGLSYYYEYRTTHDVDAWWQEHTTSQDRQAVLDCLQKALQPFGELHLRNWGDVTSIELIPTGETSIAFSFQIAQRSARIAPSVPAPWPENLQLDSFSDLLASKTVALVERGAPRDFRDVYALCQSGLASPVQCWQLWKQRQSQSHSDVDSERARLALQTHLARLAVHRPLEQIADPGERSSAASLRTWFANEFIDAILD
ncbi:MAG: nucleotidyl transferase AbiEii/AbiGii toxin family protein [Chloroflexota bacterium]